ncbi:MAG TPA: sugar transporter, partial [Achromobacter sp.]|nr:sugar transporter [Achromobacter sp.]
QRGDEGDGRRGAIVGAVDQVMAGRVVGGSMGGGLGEGGGLHGGGPARWG